MRHKISIITPSYNQGRFIEKTIKSVISQDIPNLEYIVVDGGSDDNTLDILQRYEDSLTYVSEPDQGQSDAVNKGIKMSTGDIIGWLNSDDIYYPDSIQTILNYFDNHPDVDVVYGKAYHIDENDNIINEYPTMNWNLKILFKFCYLSQPAVFFRKRVVEQYGLLNENLHYCLDYEFWLRLALNGVGFAYIDKFLAGSRFYPETKTMSQPVKACEEAMTMIKEHIGYVPQTWFFSYAKAYLKNTHVSGLKYLFKLYVLTIATAIKWRGRLKGLLVSFSFPWIIYNKTKLKIKGRSSICLPNR